MEEGRGFKKYAALQKCLSDDILHDSIKLNHQGLIKRGVGMRGRTEEKAQEGTILGTRCRSSMFSCVARNGNTVVDAVFLLAVLLLENTQLYKSKSSSVPCCCR